MNIGAEELTVKTRRAALSETDPRTIGLVTFLWLILLAFLGLYQLNPPSPVAATAPLAEFSSARAMEHLKVIARQPHPMGAAEHAAVRDYIVGQLNSMGVHTEVQQTTSASTRHGAPFAAGTVWNILARLEGTSNSRAILLVAHYDSVPAGPGANDDGSGVVTLIETLRALTAGPPLQNDVILLFTDGEEAGLLGAKAFVAEHPWAREVGLVLNFEARGNSGPSLMFETSHQNGWLIQEFARAAPHPFASSLFYDVYQYLPNDTDFSIFKEAGLAGFNFAYIDGFTHYHSALDSIEHVGEGSLQHHGTYALALTRHFGNLNLNEVHASNAVYFDLLGVLLVHYPGALVIPLMLLTLLVFVGVIVLGFRKRLLTFWGIVLGFFAFLLNLVLSALVVVPLGMLIARLHPEFMTYGDTYNRNLYLISLVSLILALTTTLQVLLRSKIRIENLAIGGVFWWGVLAVLTSLLLPGGSYLFVWPLLFGLVGLGVAFAAPAQEQGMGRRFLVLLLCAAPAVILYAPFIYMLFISLTIRLGIAVAIVLTLLLGLLMPQLYLMTTPKRWLLPALALVVGCGALIGGVLTSGATPERPRLTNVLYGLNADTGQAIWATSDTTLDDWSAQFFPDGVEQGPLTDFFPLAPDHFLRGTAPTTSLPKPEVTLLEDSRAGDTRMLRLRVSSPRQAPTAWIYADSKTGVRSATVNGKPIAADANALVGAGWGMVYWALPPEGIELRLEVMAFEPVTIRVVDRTDGLPELPGMSFAPRPETVLPAPSMWIARYSNATLVSTSLTLE